MASRVTGCPSLVRSSRAARAAGSRAVMSVPSGGMVPVPVRGAGLPQVRAAVAATGGSGGSAGGDSGAASVRRWRWDGRAGSGRPAPSSPSPSAGPFPVSAGDGQDGSFGGGGTGTVPVLKHAGQSLTAISSAIVGQPAMTRLIGAGPAVATFAARLAAVPMGRAARSPRPAPACGYS